MLVGLVGKHDKQSLEALAILEEEEKDHAKFHSDEREVHDDAKIKSERSPHLLVSRLP